MNKVERDEQWIEKGGPEPSREEGERAKGPNKAEDEESSQAAEQERAEAEAHAAEQSRRVGMVLGSVQNVLDGGTIEFDRDLPPATANALEALHQAKTGQGKDGESLAGAARNKLLNEALAQLRPVLALGHSPAFAQFEEDLDVIREDAAELRQEIRQRIFVEAHRGKVRQDQPVDKAEKIVEGAKLSKMGSLAWELARLGRKKRKPFDHDPEEHPIVDAFDTMSRYALILGTIGARLAVLEVRLAKLSDIWVRRRGALEKHVGANRMSMVNTVLQFLRSCDSDSGVTGDIGSHAALRARFEPLVKQYSDVTHSDQAIPAALDIVKMIDSCLDDHAKLMKTAENGDSPDKPKKKGWFSRS